MLKRGKYFEFLVLFGVFGSTFADPICQLEGVPAATLHGKMATIYSVRYARGLEAVIHFNVVRHNPCPGSGGCKWIFNHCKGNEFSLESKRYRGSHMFANIAQAVSHFNKNKGQACADPGYRWKVWYDRCSNHYYLQNTYFGDWLDASETGLVKHTACKTNPFGTTDSCGDWRRWRFEDMTVRYDSQ